MRRTRLVCQRGIALVMVLWMLVLFVVLLGGMVAGVRGDLGAVYNFKEDRQAYFLAMAGFNMAVKEIMAPADFHYYVGNQLRFARLEDEERNPSFAERSDIPFGAGYVSYVITEENDRLSINGVTGDEKTLRDFLEILYPDGFTGIDTVVDSLLDWRDLDSEPRPNGAEDQYYNSFTPPYSSKNGSFDTLNELRRVKGMTEPLYAQMCKFLTRYPTYGVNLNTASPTVMKMRGISDDLIAKIMEEREKKGFYITGGWSTVFVITATGYFETGKEMLKHSIRAVVVKAGWNRVRILDWEDDYFEVDEVVMAGGEKIGGE